MKIQLVILSSGPILVSDEEIKNLDKVYTPNGIVTAGSGHDEVGWLDKKDGKFLYFGTEGSKIIAGIEGLPSVDIDDLSIDDCVVLTHVVLTYVKKPFDVEVEMEDNQCDGCKAKLPVENGIHRDAQSMGIGCTKHLYDRPKNTNNAIKVTKIL